MKKEKVELTPEQKKKRLMKSLIIAGSVIMAIVIVIVSVIGAAVAASKRDETVANGTMAMLGNLMRSKKSINYQTFGDEALYPVDNFRVSMSAMNHWEDGTDYAKYDYTYSDTNGHTANTLQGLQEMFNYYGATEMYVRINTTRFYPTNTNLKDYYHIRMHCLEESKKAVNAAVALVCQSTSNSAFLRVTATHLNRNIPCLTNILNSTAYIRKTRTATARRGKI